MELVNLMDERQKRLLCFMTRVRDGLVPTLKGGFKVNTDHGEVTILFQGQEVRMNWYDREENTWHTFGGTIERASAKLYVLNPDAKSVRQ